MTPLRLSGRDVAGAVPVWLLDLWLGGRVWRVASQAVTLESEDGDVSYAGGLTPPDVDEQVDRMSIALAGAESAIEVVIAADVAEVRATGHRLAQARAELAMVWVGADGAPVTSTGGLLLTWERRTVVLRGRLVEPQWGDPDQPPGWIAATVAEMPWEDRRTLLDVGAVIDDATWGTYLDHFSGGVDYPRYTGSSGKAYPLVYGAPGSVRDVDGATTRVAGSPAYVLHYANVGNLAVSVLIAGHPVTATSVELTDGEDWESFSVSHAMDLRGVRVAVIDVSGAVTISRAVATEFWAAWTDGGGLPEAQEGKPEAGLGTTIGALLARSSLPIDWPKMRLAALALDRVAVGGYVNDPDVTPWDYVSEHLASLLPMSIVTGPDGLFPVLYRSTELSTTVGAVLVAGEDMTADGPVETEDAEPLSAIEIRWAHDGAANRPTRAVLITGDVTLADATLDTSASAMLHQTVSRMRDASRTAPRRVSSQVIWSRQAADSVALAMAEAVGLDVETAAYQLAANYAWVAPGMWVAVTDADRRWTARVGMVSRRRWTRAAWSIEVLFVEDPARDLRSG